MKILKEDFKIECNKAFSLLDHTKDSVYEALLMNTSRNPEKNQWYEILEDVVSDPKLNSLSEIIESLVKRIQPETIFELFLIASIFGAKVESTTYEQKRIESLERMQDFFKNLDNDGSE